METLTVCASVATILSFIISIFVLNKVNKIDKSIKKKKQTIKGNKNILSGRDSNVQK